MPTAPQPTPPITKLAFIDFTTKNELPNADLTAMADAILLQLYEASVAYGVAAPLQLTVESSAHVAQLDADTAVIGVWDTSDVANAAGYHTTDPRGRPYGKAFMDKIDCLRNTRHGGSFALATDLSHEALELWLDKGANLFALRGDGQTIDCREVCDAVEDMTYPDPHEPSLDSACALSNYLYESAFTIGGQAPFDRLGVLTAGDQTSPGGYRNVMIASPVSSNPGAPAMQTFAVYGPNHLMSLTTTFPNTHPAVLQARRRAKTLPGARSTLRGATQWIPLEAFETSSPPFREDLQPPTPPRPLGRSMPHSRPGIVMSPRARIISRPAQPLPSALLPVAVSGAARDVTKVAPRPSRGSSNKSPVMRLPASLSGSAQAAPAKRPTLLPKQAPQIASPRIKASSLEPTLPPSGKSNGHRGPIARMPTAAGRAPTTPVVAPSVTPVVTPPAMSESRTQAVSVPSLSTNTEVNDFGFLDIPGVT